MKCNMAIGEQILFCDWPLHGLEICKALIARGKKHKSTNLKKFNSQL